ncbi:unnamed protein product [Amoebophrya sp. A25]|nr:unnamed protein product [Amoebophrya sp. A25]|eukprot:GSA25T00002485001.1
MDFKNEYVPAMDWIQKVKTGDPERANYDSLPRRLQRRIQWIIDEFNDDQEDNGMRGKKLLSHGGDEYQLYEYEWLYNNKPDFVERALQDKRAENCNGLLWLLDFANYCEEMIMLEQKEELQAHETWNSTEESGTEHVSDSDGNRTGNCNQLYSAAARHNGYV